MVRAGIAMAQRSRLLKRRGGGLVLGLVAVVSCGPNSVEDEPCYADDLWADFDGHPSERGYCEMDRPPVPEGLPEPQGEPDDVNYDDFLYCFDDVAVCDGCPLEDTEAMMIAAFREDRDCEAPIAAYIPGCVIETDDGQCCFRAVIASSRQCIDTIIE